MIGVAIGLGLSVWGGVALAQPSSSRQMATVESGGVQTAAAAIAIAERDPEIRGVKSSSAKRATLGQTIAATGASVPGAGTSPRATVWVVGLRARLVTPSSVIPTHDDWAIATIDQRSGQVVAFAAGPDELPGWYRELP